MIWTSCMVSADCLQQRDGDYWSKYHQLCQKRAYWVEATTIVNKRQAVHHRDPETAMRMVMFRCRPCREWILGRRPKSISAEELFLIATSPAFSIETLSIGADSSTSPSTAALPAPSPASIFCRLADGFLTAFSCARNAANEAANGSSKS